MQRSRAISERFDECGVMAKNLKELVAPHAARGITYRSRGQIEADRVWIAQMYIRGMSQGEIARQLGERMGRKVTSSAIGKEIKLIQEAWLSTYIKDFDELRSKELAHVDELERAYWEEYLASKKDIEEHERDEETWERPVVVNGVLERQITQRSREIKRVKGKDANAVFLQGVQWCIEQRCRILGLLAPTRLDISWRKQAKAQGFDPESIVDGLVRDIVEGADPIPALESSNPTGTE